MKVNAHDVIIIGGGPVGMLLANLLGTRGVRTLVVERRTQPEVRSMAIGITPPSLAILRRVGLDAACLTRGARVRRVVVRDQRRRLGTVDFGVLPAPDPFILCLPQAMTMAILEAGARRFACVDVRMGTAIAGFDADADGVMAHLRACDGGDAGEVAGRFLVGCDGHASAVRGLAGIDVRGKQFAHTFLMADFDDARGQPDDEAQLYFTATGSVEAFPLPERRRRWVVMTDRLELQPSADRIAELVHARTGIDLAGVTKHFESPFRVEQFVSRTYVRDRVVLCGDAAHVMSPIGGLGMNTGFADADMLAESLHGALQGAPGASLLRRYACVRRHAFRTAARHANLGMWLGTRRGDAASWLRSRFLAGMLLRAPLRDFLPGYFAMPGAVRAGARAGSYWPLPIRDRWRVRAHGA